MNFVPGGRFEVGSTKQLPEDDEEEDVEEESAQEPDAKDEEESSEEEEEEDEFAHVRLPTSFGGGGRGRRGLGGPDSPMQADAEGEAAAPTTTAWGSSYGARLLGKMGWTGGGIKTSTGEGIDRPIEVRLRGKNEGIAFRGSEKTQQQIEMEMKQAGRLPKKVNAKKEKKPKKGKKREPAWKKKLMEGSGEPLAGVKGEEEEDDGEMDVDGRSRRRRKGRGGKVYKTAEEVLASQKAEKQLILDMTQAQPRVLTDMKQATKGMVAEGQKTKGGRGMPAPELQHNIKFFVDMKEMELQNIDRRIRQEETTKDKLKRQEARLQKNIDARADQMKRLKTIMEIVDKCNERIKANDMPLETLEKVFDMFRNKYAHEYEVYKLSSLAYSLVGPLVKGKMGQWQPLKDPGLLVELVTTWRKILRSEADRADEDGVGENGGGGGARDELSERILRPKGPNSADMYNRMIVDIVLPVIRRGVVNEWNPRDFGSGIRLVRLWAPPVLTREAYENLMMHFIFPKIAREVDSWNPRQDTMPIHAWLHPWLPFLRKQMESLFPTVRHKLGAALVEWHPSDASAHAILVPWRGVFDAGSMEALLGRSILPKLILSLRELVINPLHQNLDPFNWVMSWVDMISPVNFIPLLEMEFFPKWFAVLHNWLGSAAPNFEEVSKWYSGWKQLFPADLQSQPRMQAQFNHALEIMNYHVQRIMGGGVAATPPPQPPTPSTVPITPAARQPTSSAAPPTRPSPAATAATSTTKEPTMRDVVARWAEDNDLVFMPQGRAHEGKQVYSFGSLAVYLDKDLVYAPPAAGSPVDKWLPIGFDELLVRGR
jgi:tuftelin-interacting protein 11